MLRFDVETKEGVDACKNWIREVLDQVQVQQVTEYADSVLGWMGALSGILSITQAKAGSLAIELMRKSACIVGSNLNLVGELKYRTLDMICVLDNEYCAMSHFKTEIDSLLALANRAWVVLEIASRTLYRMLDLRKQESRTPPVSPQFLETGSY